MQHILTLYVQYFLYTPQILQLRTLATSKRTYMYVREYLFLRVYFTGCFHKLYITISIVMP